MFLQLHFGDLPGYIKIAFLTATSSYFYIIMILFMFCFCSHICCQINISWFKTSHFESNYR